MNKVGRLTLQHGRFLAYHKYIPENATSRYGLVFCQGFLSQMTGVKGNFLARYCQRRKVPYVRFDYEGHGESSGELKDLSFTIWKENTMSVLQELTDGPQIVVGSSMGAWMAVLAAYELPEKIKAMVGVASATDIFYRRYLELSDEEQTNVQRQGCMEYRSAYFEDAIQIPFAMIEDAKKNRVLINTIPLDCPIRLIHGMNDMTVPFKISLELAEKLRSHDVQVIFIKDGDHRLSTDRDLEILQRTLDDLYIAINM